MKHFLLTLLLMAGTSLVAQAQSFTHYRSMQPDSVITYDEDSVLKEKIVFSYTDRDSVLSKYEYKYKDGAWENNIRYEYAYDANGNMASRTYSEWEDGAWYADERYEYTYTADNQLLVSYMWGHSNPMDDSLVCKVHTDYTYLAGILVEKNYYAMTDTGWCNAEKDTYTYDNLNRLLSTTQQKLSSGVLKNYRLHQFTYGDNGQPRLDTYYSWKNEDWTPYGHYEYVYNELNLLESQTWSDVKNNEWVNSSKKSNSYSEDGLMLNYTEYRWRDTVWVNFVKHDYTYDENARRISDVESGWYTDVQWAVEGSDYYFYPAYVTALCDPEEAADPARKVLLNGRVLILTPQGTFDLSGRRIE